MVLGSAAHAQPPPPAVPTPAEAAALVEPQVPADPIVLRRSYGWATIHVLALNAGFSVLGLLVFDKDYLRISPGSVWENVTGPWAWDDDDFTTNQFGHPYFGNLSFNAARSNGIGFWGSSLASFASSLFWELVMETATPSINDQLFTPAGGIMLGESLHRLGEAIRWRDRSFPSRALAFAVDPMGAVSRWTHGDAYVLMEPPSRFGYLSFGWNGLSVDFDAPAGHRIERMIPRVHAAIAQSYGLPTDARFQPRRPLDHFELLFEGDFSEEGASLSLNTRGMLWGRAARLSRGGAIGGVMASYDFMSQARTRVSAVSVGLGGVVHRPFGDGRFVQVHLGAGFIPYGAAGEDVYVDPEKGESSHSSYHRGPGATGLLDLRLGWRGYGLAYANARSYYIDAAPFGEGTELVSHARVGVIAGLHAPHAVQLEGMFSSRRATFAEARRDAVDTSAQLRISYTYTSDFDFGGAPSR